MTNTQIEQGNLEKATITIFFKDGSGTQTIKCKFNPKEYSISRSNGWKIGESKEKDIGNLNFSGGQPANLKLQLLFDDYDNPDNASKRHVLDSTRLLWKAMRIQTIGTTPKYPPHCQFCWGEVWSFMAVITSLSQKFVMFDRSGKPLRAIVDISFMQVQEEDLYPKQNPTSGGGAGEHIRIVRAGDTLAGIAFEEYGDPKVWRHLADTNKIRNPLSLSPGQTLLITPLPLV